MGPFKLPAQFTRPTSERVHLVGDEAPEWSERANGELMKVCLALGSSCATPDCQSTHLGSTCERGLGFGSGKNWNCLLGHSSSAG